jgi:hypothetical protein
MQAVKASSRKEAEYRPGVSQLFPGPVKDHTGELWIKQWGVLGNCRGIRAW